MIRDKQEPKLLSVPVCIGVLFFLAVFGLVGEMDYADACRSDPQCTYEGWAK